MQANNGLQKPSTYVTVFFSEQSLAAIQTTSSFDWQLGYNDAFLVHLRRGPALAIRYPFQGEPPHPTE
jgi:hypothetical protein